MIVGEGITAEVAVEVGGCTVAVLCGVGVSASVGVVETGCVAPF